ncbi:MAG: glycosyltransferase family 87 protein [Jaaginema sp. PMC 1079.18]|nr:glycosyltransferase family 87 protein [Jaaginema sp. PMC 1080.18]MEC4852178.1 glycosyltransferase family 87 protein [Jaaginema sp. PMC 1079.18]MEC4864927.1 glycosyltransferase family 87 protein [Jaaginema sp. PMC 1078.18]
MIQKWLDRITQNRAIRLVFVIAACLALLSFGIVGIGRDGGLFQSGSDMKFMYFAGRTWLQGLNAYNPEIASRISENAIAVERYDFAYPPQIAPLSLGLALFPFAIARWLMVGLNLLSLTAIIILSLLWIEQPETANWRLKSSGYRWFIPGLIIGNPFTAHIVWMGQSSLIALATLMAGWYAMRRDRPILGGIAIAIATIKPQLAILIVLWLILSRRWRVLGIAAIAGSIFCLVPILISGPIQVWFDWFDAIAIYKSQPYNMLGFRHMFGIQNTLAIMELPAPSLLPLALGLTAAVWWYQRKFVSDDIFGILIVISLLFGFAHDYDLVTLVPLLPLFWVHLHRRPLAIIGAIALLLGLFFPQRFLRPLEIELLLQFRVFIVAILGIWLVKLSMNQSRAFKSPNQQTELIH